MSEPLVAPVSDIAPSRGPVRIEKIEVIPIEIPLTGAFAGSRYHISKRSAVVTRVHAGNGVVGEIYNGDNRTQLADLANIVERDLAPLAVGEDVFAVERIWQKLFAATQWNRDRKVMMQAVACLDCAIWDALGKSLGVNIGRLLGGFRSEIPIISIGGYYATGKGEFELAREMQRYRENGIGGCKVKVGGLSPEEDARRVVAARKGGGAAFKIAVDANQAWSKAEAIRFAALIEELDVVWFEEPCTWYDDARDMAEVRRRISIPITAGQTEITSHGVRRLIDADAIDIINFNASLGGGVTEWRRVSALASVYNLTMSHHEEPHVAMQLLSSTPQSLCIECFDDPGRDPIWNEMVLNRPLPKNGMVEVLQGPGFGLELDHAMIERFRLA
jgi:L-alanine-DL-glutamate epimerase-like enolase superfamily enzyme